MGKTGGCMVAWRGLDTLNETKFNVGGAEGLQNASSTTMGRSTMGRNAGAGGHASYNPRVSGAAAKYVEEPVKEDRKPPETEAAQLHGQSLRRFVRNTVTNDQGQRDATLEGKASHEN
eukprot:gene13108-31409_t